MHTRTQSFSQNHGKNLLSPQRCRNVLLSLLFVGGVLYASPATFAQTLIHQWAFEGNATDLVGGADATLVNGASISSGAVVLDGIDDYVTLPIGGTIAGLTDTTVLAWVTWPAVQPAWARIFDFGIDAGSSYMFLTTRNNVNDSARFTISTTGLLNEQQTSAPNPGAPTPNFPTGTLTCVAVTIDATAQIHRLYVGGTEVAANLSGTLTPSSLGNTPNNWIGRSQFIGIDPFFAGSIAEFRIYDSALSGADVASTCSAGPISVSTAIPTLGGASLALLGLLLAGTGAVLVSRRRT